MYRPDALLFQEHLELCRRLQDIPENSQSEEAEASQYRMRIGKIETELRRRNLPVPTYLTSELQQKRPA